MEKNKPHRPDNALLQPIPLNVRIHECAPKITSDEKNNRQKTQSTTTITKLNREKCEINARKMNYYFEFQICLLCLYSSLSHVPESMYGQKCIRTCIYAQPHRTLLKNAIFLLSSQADSCFTYCLQVFFCVYILRFHCQYGSSTIYIPYIGKQRTSKVANSRTKANEYHYVSMFKLGVAFEL